jgi:hypothetical protein
MEADGEVLYQNTASLRYWGRLTRPESYGGLSSSSSRGGSAGGGGGGGITPSATAAAAAAWMSNAASAGTGVTSFAKWMANGGAWGEGRGAGSSRNGRGRPHGDDLSAPWRHPPSLVLKLKQGKQSRCRVVVPFGMLQLPATSHAQRRALAPRHTIAHTQA